MPELLPYNREAAVAYAHRWAYFRNPAYFDYSGIGGDCTNFASQCVFAGAGVMNFTPTYGSWMNLVERWFSALTTKKLQRSAHVSVKALAADITAWVEHWNADPKPFTWHKTADQILQRLAGYCHAINK